MTVCAITSSTHSHSQGTNAPLKEAIMPQHHEQRRKHAIDRYLAGDKIDDICRQMACSKSWLYKWKTRYQAGNLSRAKERSRRPSRHADKTPQRIEQAVIEMRRTLDQNGQRCGAQAIRHALEHHGIAAPPSLRTIYRILQRQKRRKDKSPLASGDRSPEAC